MKYYRPFCKINTAYSTGSFEINFQDTSGNLLDCNYINVGTAASLNFGDIYEMELIGTSGLQSFLGSLSSTNASGGFVTTFTHFRPAELILPPGVVANGVRITRSSGTGTRTIYINYGVLIDQPNPLKAQGKYKGV
jgi:hypothetical protein